MKSLKEDFSLMLSLLIPVAVAINFTGFGIAKLLQVPIFQPLEKNFVIFLTIILNTYFIK